MKAGGGVLGLVVVVVAIVLTQMSGGSSTNAPSAVDDGGVEVKCQTEIEQIVCGAVDDVSIYWEGQFPQSFQGQFSGTDTVFFRDAVQTSCGNATSQTGPFYCPADQLVYLDLDFLQQLQQEFGATGDLAAQYIVAHEYGHHVQNITGISDRMRAAQQATGDESELSVALELQADCFAGTWAASVSERDLLDDPTEIDEALGAAEAVGDDRIMEQAGREVDPDSFTHGSAAQRREWFATGYETADPERCTTFDGSLAP